MNPLRWLSCEPWLRWAAPTIFGLFLLPAGAAAATVGINAQYPGPTPFIVYLDTTVTGGTLAGVGFAIAPKPGSLTRPIEAGATASYLAAHGAINGGHVFVPVAGLYAGQTSQVTLYFFFADGSTVQQTVPIATPAYTDPCLQVNEPVIQNNRVAQSDINFDYFMVKDYCSANSPAIFDTDGTIRWVGFSGGGSLPGLFYKNAVYSSDTATGVKRLDLYGFATEIGDYSSIGVTSTNPHNIDPGRDGIVVDVNTTSDLEADAIEINPDNGALLQHWDLGQIISAAMTAGGDDPSQFVYANGSTDWFHMNATTYNPADNTLILSSRENFVIAVDYDVPADGIRKIHWILGDTTKHWYQFASLRQYALSTPPGTLPPIGQHAVSIDTAGNLLLFDDGFGSEFQVPAGITRGYSVVNSYKIDTVGRTATAVYNYDPEPAIYSSICGSAYDAGNGSHLIDFATSANDTLVDIQGLSATNNLVFELKLPQTNYCSVGWNASPLPSVPIVYQ